MNPHETYSPVPGITVGSTSVRVMLTVYVLPLPSAAVFYLLKTSPMARTNGWSMHQMQDGEVVASPEGRLMGWGLAPLKV